MTNKIYEYLKDKTILLLGFGREGKSTYNFFRHENKEKLIEIADLNEITDPDVLNDKYVKIYTGKDYLNECYNFDIIIKGPGVIIKDYLPVEIKEKITCQVDLFLKYYAKKCIGITGTKGKSTTVNLLNHILNNLGKKAILMGNIGIPIFDVIDKIDDNTICILELSSHQLEFTKNSPHISAILDIYEEHLDHYVSMEAYVDAKKNIYRYQKEDDYVLLGDSPYLKDNNIKSKTLIENKQFTLNNDNLIIEYDRHIEIPISKIKTNLVGRHNLYNILVCLTIINILGYDIEKSINKIANFTGLPHRLEYVGTYHNILYYDDSIATSAESVIFAIEALKKVNTIIIGGMDRGINYNDLVKYLDKSTVKNILLLPNTSIRIKEIFDSINSSKNILIVKDMVEAVNNAKKLTEKNKICLLSPGAASYGFYKNFEERGNHFKLLVSTK